MHELGVVFHIIKQVDEIAEQNNAKHVSKVTLRIGEVTTIIPHYLEDVWKWAVDNRSKYMKGCLLNIEIIPGVTRCEDCGQEYPTVTYAKKCPNCGSENTYLIKGNEVEIKDIEVTDE